MVYKSYTRLNMKNKVIAQKLQHQTMSEVSKLIVALQRGTTQEVSQALTDYSISLQKIVDLVDMPCGKPNCGYFSCKEEMCDRMAAESWEVQNDQ